MKRLKKIGLICLIFCVILINYNVFAQTGIVTGKNVRLRESATTGSKILSTMSKNEEIEILDEEENWYKVKYKDNTGYASKEYIQIEENQEPSSEENNDKIQDGVSEKAESDNKEQIINIGSEYILQRDCKLRKRPNFASIVLEELKNGDKIIINKQIGNWIEITAQNKQGWILKIVVENIVEYKENEEIEVTQPIQPEIEFEEKPRIENNINEVVDDEKQEETNVKEEKNESTNVSISKGYVNAETVNVRTGPSTDSKRLGFLDLNDEVEIIAEEGDWYKINTKEYGECYISKKLISPTRVTSRGENIQRNDTVSQEKNQELIEALNNSSNLGNEIVNFANQYLGYKYVSGGKKPETGFDCSGFTRYVYSNFGISLGATAASQANNSGTEVSREDLQIGDLILFQDDAKTRIGHCGIYIGNNMFIHAANPKRGVVTDKLDGNSYYSPRYVSAYRF